MIALYQQWWLRRTHNSRFELVAGMTATIAVTAVAGIILTPQQASGRLIMMVVAAGICAALLSRAVAAIAVSGLGYLLFIGVLAGPLGFWDVGSVADGQFFAFAVATMIGLGCRRLRAVQADAALEAELHDLLDRPAPGGNDRQSAPG